LNRRKTKSWQQCNNC